MVGLHIPFRLLLCGWLLAISGCASPGAPVQEMSDARQAIAAAREAGAATYAGEELRSAEAWLAQAETELQKRSYWDAKVLAVGAKESAIDALLRSRSAQEFGTTGAPKPHPH